MAVGGTDTVVVTSASGEMAVVCWSVSGSVFGPWLVDVPMPALTPTAPLPGAVNATPSVMAEPAPRLAGIPVSVTIPVAGL